MFPCRPIRLTALCVLAAAARAQAPDETGASSKDATREPNVVKMERFIVEEHADQAGNAFADKKISEAIAERLSESALQRPGAEAAGDLLKGVSGVTVSSDGDGGSKIAIRGMDSRFNRVAIDGQRQSGTHALDSLPPEIVKSLEVMKALTPDMDADAIGGAINVTTGDAADLKEGFAHGRHQIFANSSTHRPGWRTALTLGRPLRVPGAVRGEPNAGVIVGASFDDQFRWRENVESNGDWPSLLSPGPAPFAGRSIPAYTQARIETTHDEAVKKSALLNADYHPGEHTSVFLRSNYNSDLRRRNRARTFFDVGEGTPVALTPAAGVFSGVHLQQRNTLGERERAVLTVALGGRTTVGRAHFDGHIGYARASEREPSSDTAFRSDHAYRIGYDTRPDAYRIAFTFDDETDPGNTVARTNASQYAFEQLVLSDIRGREEEISSRLDATWNLNEAQRPAFVKFGGKFQHRNRETRTALEQFDRTATRLPLDGLVGQGAVALRTDGYVVGPTPNAWKVADRRLADSNAFSFAGDESLIASAGGTYDSTETVWSGYGMARVPLGRWTWLAGVRAEATRYTARGNQLVLSNESALPSVESAHARGSYLNVLPGLHVRYEPRSDVLLRASVTRSLVRPDYRDLSPRQTVSVIDRRITTGNPKLRPYEAINYDLSFDWYSERLGLFSLAPFRKEIAHFIAERKQRVSYGGRDDFTMSQSINGDTARVWGIETGWQSTKLALPPSAGTLSVQLNYTYARSEARLPDRASDLSPLPEQARHQAGGGVTIERGALSVELALRYRSDVLEDVVGPARDVFVEGGLDAELSVAYKLRGSAKITAGVVNLTNRPELFYSGDRQHQKEFEASIVGVNIGIQWKR